MSAQVDGARLHMDVHQVVDDLALDVVLDAVDKEATPDINYLDEREVPVGQRGSSGEQLPVGQVQYLTQSCSPECLDPHSLV